MRRPLCTVLVSFVLVTNLSEAQESKSQSSETGAHSTLGDDVQIMSLLQQSHDINQQLPVSARFYLLTQQAQLASQMRADLGRAWADELFILSFQAKGDQRSTTQESAMGILARLDPDRADIASQHEYGGTGNIPHNFSAKDAVSAASIRGIGHARWCERDPVTWAGGSAPGHRRSLSLWCAGVRRDAGRLKGMA